MNLILPILNFKGRTISNNYLTVLEYFIASLEIGTHSFGDPIAAATKESVLTWLVPG